MKEQNAPMCPHLGKPVTRAAAAAGKNTNLSKSNQSQISYYVAQKEAVENIPLQPFTGLVWTLYFICIRSSLLVCHRVSL